MPSNWHPRIICNYVASAPSPFVVAAEEKARSAGRAPPLIFDKHRHEQALRGALADIAAEKAAAERRREALADIAAEERRREGASEQIAIAAAVAAEKEPLLCGRSRALSTLLVGTHFKIALLNMPPQLRPHEQFAVASE